MNTSNNQHVSGLMNYAEGRACDLPSRPILQILSIASDFLFLQYLVQHCTVGITV